MERFKVGYVGAHQAIFLGDKEAVMRRSIEELQALGKELDFELVTVPGGIVTAEDAEQARRQFNAAGVDFVLLQNSSFASGKIVPALVEGLDARLGLWAVPEPASRGALPLNSFCGANMYASIIGQYLRENHVPYKWFYGFADHELFLPRFVVTARALRAIKLLAQSKVALIGGLAPGFDDLYYDERTVAAIYGVRIERLHEYAEIVARVDSYAADAVEREARSMLAEATACDVTTGGLEQGARVSLALRDLAQEHGYQALAVSCWPKFTEEMHFRPCASMAYLNGHGLVNACEGDALSALSMLLLNYVSRDVSMLMDLSDFDEQNDSVFMWHCGPAPARFAGAAGSRIAPHSLDIEADSSGGSRGMPMVNDMVFAPGPTTVMRVTDDGRSLLAFTADILEEGKCSFDGSRGWFGNLRMDGRQVRARELINTIFAHRFPHHYPICAGHFEHELREIAAWLGVSVLEPVPYTVYLKDVAP